MAIIDKKITFTVQEITDKGETVLWGSPGDPLFVTIDKAENYLNVGDTFDGPVVAKYDDGVPEPALSE